MNVTFLAKGIIIGFSIAAPVGPIGVLCIRRSISKGRLSGLITGLGAASADAVYGVIAAFGLTFISSFLIDRQIWLNVIGMIFLGYLGIKTYFKEPRTIEHTQVNRSSLVKDYLSTFFLTITNPMTILSFAAVFAGLGVGQTGGDYIAATAIVSGVFIGSAVWWIILSNGIGMFRKKIQSGLLVWINRISGAVIIGFAIVILITLIQELG
jgi:threonine/homoserine/homoserine lactone efflux protein